MQTILESLEQAYLNLMHLREESLKENMDTYCREEVYCALSELTKAIVLLIINNNDLFPLDKRVYVDITENNNAFCVTDQCTKDEFLNILYNNEILIKDKTVGELIEELSRFSPSLKISICGNNNKDNKVVVDDTYIDKVVLVGVER